GSLEVVGERLPAALRFMTPAHILEDEYIAAAGEEQRLLIGTRITLRAVRRAGEQYRIFAILGGAVHVGVELHAIAHRHGDVVIYFYVIRGWIYRREFGGRGV